MLYISVGEHARKLKFRLQKYAPVFSLGDVLYKDGIPFTGTHSHSGWQHPSGISGVYVGLEWEYLASLIQFEVSNTTAGPSFSVIGYSASVGLNILLA